jgi:hypothetical protein
MTTTPIVTSAINPSSRRARTYWTASTISSIGERVETTVAAPRGRPTSTTPASVLVAAAMRKTPPTPNHVSPINTPANAGATTRIASCTVWLSVTAGWIISGSTTSAMKAIRAGRYIANATACTALATSNIQ